jgi:aspartyl-tRNA(Asn)/glutamyl-tRNA(Gln) amidotransferase subunit C
MGESSSVGPEVVRKIAALARLRVPDAELSTWSRQLSRIVSYIDQLTELPEEDFRARPPEPTPLRADSASDGEGQRALETNAPALLHGHGVVPRVVGGISSEAGAEPQASLPSVGLVSKRQLKNSDTR